MLKNKLVSSLVLIVFGVLIAVWPGASAEILSRLFGLAVLIYGVVGIIQYFLKKDSEKSSMRLILSAVFTIVGILILTNISAVIAIVPIIIGVYIALNGAIDAVTALQHKESESFMRDIILAVVTFALGIIIFVNPFTTAKGLMVMVGLTMIYLGVSGLVTKR